MRAEGKTGATRCFFFIHAAIHVFFDLTIKVEMKLVFEFLLNGFVAKEGAEAVTQIIQHGGLCSFQNLIDGYGEFAPCFCFKLKLELACAGKLVELCAAVVVGDAPLGANPAAALKAVKGRVERALLNAEDFTGDLLHAL
jgi:hypothetical protein